MRKRSICHLRCLLAAMAVTLAVPALADDAGSPAMGGIPAYSPLATPGMPGAAPLGSSPSLTGNSMNLDGPSAYAPPSAAAGTSLLSRDAAGTAPPPATLTQDGPWSFQFLPEGLVYKNYLAGQLESRLSAEWTYDNKLGWVWDSTLGAHIGIFRYGTEDRLLPEGFQLDIEAAAFPRLHFTGASELAAQLDATDYRVGVPLTMRSGRWESKFGYYHICSHLGDHYQLLHMELDQDNYIRDSLIWGLGFRPTESLRLYAEADWAFSTYGEAQPWAFQFGVEFSQMQPTGPRGSPFFAANAHLRQEVDFGGAFTAQAGWQWRNDAGRLLRIGMEYFDGSMELYQLGNDYVRQIGAGLWYDF